MIKEPFALGNSWIHRIDPRLRIIFAIALSFVIALSESFYVLGAGLFIAIMLAFMARLDAKEAIKRLAVVFWFLVLIWIFLPITFEGKVLYVLGPFAITLPGIILSAKITVKSIAILLIFMALIATMSIASLGHALDRIGFPSKLVHLLLMTYRYIFVIEDEYKRLWTAIKIRGFKPKTNIHSYKTYAYLIGMLFVRASVRGDRVYQAMKCRGFKGKFYTLDNSESLGKDKFFAFLMIFFLFGLIILEFY